MFNKPSFFGHKEGSKIKFQKIKKKRNLDRIFYICLKRWKFVEI